eukprot:SAG22_NODE_978_length_6192_cov_2.764320_2_plen_67_part_00
MCGSECPRSESWTGVDAPEAAVQSQCSQYQSLQLSWPISSTRFDISVKWYEKQTTKSSATEPAATR